MEIAGIIPSGVVKVPAHQLMEKICSASINTSDLWTLRKSGQSKELITSKRIWHRKLGNCIDLFVTEAGELPIRIPPALRLRITSLGSESQVNSSYPLARLLRLLKFIYLATVALGFFFIGLVYCLELNDRALIVGSIVAMLSLLLLPGAAIGMALSKEASQQAEHLARWLNQLLNDATQETHAPAPRP